MGRDPATRRVSFAPDIREVTVPVSISKQFRAAVLGLAVLALALAPTALAAPHAAQPAGAEPGMLGSAWSRLVDLGEWLASALGIASAADESPAPAVPTTGLLPDDGQSTQCAGDCADGDSGPTMDPDG